MIFMKKIALLTMIIISFNVSAQDTKKDTLFLPAIELKEDTSTFRHFIGGNIIIKKYKKISLFWGLISFKVRNKSWQNK